MSREELPEVKTTEARLRPTTCFIRRRRIEDCVDPSDRQNRWWGRRAKTSGGMTMVEVVIATLILGWLTTGMFSLYHSIQQIIDRANRLHYATLLARERLEQLMGVGYEGLTQAPYSFDPADPAPKVITESQSAIESSYASGEVSEFIQRHLIQRVTTLYHYDDWDPGGIADYRKIEVRVIWSEDPVST